MVSTRSGRKVEPSTAQLEDVQSAPDKPKRRSTRAAAEKAVGPPHTQHLEAEHDEEDVPTAAATFKISSPVKVLTPRGGGMTPRLTPAAPAPQASPAAKSPLASPQPIVVSPARPPLTRSLSVKDLVQEVSQVPLPVGDTESEEVHGASEAHYAPKTREHRARGSALPLLGAALATVLVGLVVTLSMCRGGPLPISAPPALQPVCGPFNARFAVPLETAFAAGKQQAAAALATTCMHAARVAEAARTGWHKGVQYIHLQLRAGAVVVSAKWDDLKQQAQQLWPSLRGSKAQASTGQLQTQPGFEEVLPAAALRALVVPQGQPGFADVAEVYAHALSQQHHLHPKATGVVLACPASCDALQHTLAHAAAQPDALLMVDGIKYTSRDAAGQLQQLLATFLQHTPAGVVVLRRLADLHPAGLAVLNNALSEGGSLQLRAQAVSTTHALFLVLWDGLGAGLAGAGGEQLEALVKGQLQQAIADKDGPAVEGAAAAGERPAAKLARALRRRFEFVLVENTTPASAADAAPAPAPADVPVADEPAAADEEAAAPPAAEAVA